MSNTANTELYKLRKLIQHLEASQGCGTSMITLIIPPNTAISKSTKLLTDEYGAASNIKSRVNRSSVQSAFRSAQAKLRLIPHVPENGIALFCGEAMRDGKMLDGKGALFATLSGTTRTILHRFTVDLPKKHSRGGQSALRFFRLRDEARHNYLRQVAEAAARCFLKENIPIVQGLIIAGSADLKTHLQDSQLFSKKLQEIVLQVVDCEYGSDTGFNQAIETSANLLGGVKLVQEKQILQKYFDDTVQGGKTSYGLKDTIRALEMSAVEELILFENLDLDLIGSSVQAKEQELCESSYLCGKNGDDKVQIVDWLVENHQKFGIELVLVSDSSNEGNQFLKGFGGIGAFLRWKVDFVELNEFEMESDDRLDYMPNGGLNTTD